MSTLAPVELPDDIQRRLNVYKAVGALLLIAVWGWFALVKNDQTPIFVYLNIAVHELGHVLFQPFGELTRLIMGSGFEVLFPFVVGAVFLVVKRDLVSTAVAWGWAASAPAQPTASPGCHKEPTWAHNESVEPVRAVSIALVILAASCAGTQPGKVSPSPATTIGTSQSPPAEQRVADLSSFTQALETAGLEPRREGRIRFFEDFVGVPTRVLSFDGAEVWAMQYPTTDAFRRIRSSVSPRGDEVGTAIINWSDPPRYYGSGRLLVVYFGNRQRTLETLDLLLGHPFAGS